VGKTFRSCRPMESLFSDQIDEVLQLGMLEVILFSVRQNVIDHHKAQYSGWCQFDLAFGVKCLCRRAIITSTFRDRLLPPHPLGPTNLFTSPCDRVVPLLGIGENRRKAAT